MATAAAMAVLRATALGNCGGGSCDEDNHRRLIAMSKRWVMATAAAMAALRATALGNCGGGSCNEDGCHNSGGKDDGDGANGVGDNCPCRP